jgi:ceramide glucosyltransferase
VIVAAEEAQSPALDLAREVAARFPLIASGIIAENARFTPNPKVSNLAAAIAVARHDLILAKDSNICLEEGQLADLVRQRGPGIGLVCAVPIATQPTCFGAEIERAFINGQFAPMLHVAALLGLSIAVGKTMLFDRRDFQRAGGIAAIAPAFGDDNALGKALGRIGLRTVYAGDVVRQPLGRRSLRDVFIASSDGWSSAVRRSRSFSRRSR